jgi:hypothetical protein
MTAFASWDYRLVRQLVDGEVMVCLHEVYYDAEDHVTGWTEAPCCITGDNYWEAANALALAGGVLCVAVLDVTTDDWVWRKPGTKADVLGPAR